MSNPNLIASIINGEIKSSPDNLKPALKNIGEELRVRYKQNPSDIYSVSSIKELEEAFINHNISGGSVDLVYVNAKLSNALKENRDNRRRSRKINYALGALSFVLFGALGYDYYIRGHPFEENSQVLELRKSNELLSQDLSQSNKDLSKILDSRSDSTYFVGPFELNVSGYEVNITSSDVPISTQKPTTSNVTLDNIEQISFTKYPLSDSSSYLAIINPKNIKEGKGSSFEVLGDGNFKFTYGSNVRYNPNTNSCYLTTNWDRKEYEVKDGNILNLANKSGQETNRSLEDYVSQLSSVKKDKPNCWDMSYNNLAPTLLQISLNLGEDSQNLVPDLKKLTKN